MAVLIEVGVRGEKAVLLVPRQPGGGPPSIDKLLKGAQAADLPVSPSISRPRSYWA
jgi:hypothetical protein